MKKSLLIVLAMVVVAPAAAAVYWAAACPCGQTPGVYLWGTEATEPVTDWSFANRVNVCQVQVDAGLLSHALNLNCMATSTGDLYLSCGSCEGKRWGQAAAAHSMARLRLDGTVYPVALTRVLDPDERQRVWDARAQKLRSLENPATPPPKEATPSDDWWTFRVVSR